jgi:hypothetical protein
MVVLISLYILLRFVKPLCLFTFASKRESVSMPRTRENFKIPASSQNFARTNTCYVSPFKLNILRKYL